MTQARTRYKKGRLIRRTLVAAALSSWPLSPSGGVPVEVLHRSDLPKCCVQQLPAVITVSVSRPVICTVALYRRYRSNKETASYPCPCVPKRRVYSTAPQQDAKIVAEKKPLTRSRHLRSRFHHPSTQARASCSQGSAGPAGGKQSQVRPAAVRKSRRQQSDPYRVATLLVAASGFPAFRAGKLNSH